MTRVALYNEIGIVAPPDCRAANPNAALKERGAASMLPSSQTKCAPRSSA
jgi:hypothetical protein